jgi:polyhydroxybutyrate depolymerase
VLPDRSLLDTIAHSVTYPLVGDDAGARAAADSAVAWLVEHEDVAAAVPVGWLAAVAVERGLAVPPAPGRTHDELRRELATRLAAQPIAGRVSLALVGLCGYDLDTAGTLSRRPVRELEALLQPFEELLPHLPELHDHPSEPAAPADAEPAEAGLGEPPVAPTVATGTGIWTTPPAESAIDELRAHAAEPPRRLRVSPGTAISLLAVLALVLLVTVPHGERPSFAEGSRLGSGTGAPGACDGAPDRSARGFELGAGRRTARFFLPPGANRALPLIVLLGDAGQSAADAADTTGLEGAAATQGFAVVTVDGSTQDWNVAGVPGRADDVDLVGQAITAARATGCVDAQRGVVLVGYGRGGHLAAVVACRAAEQVAAVAMVRGAYLPPGCAPSRPVTVLMESDTTDAVTPFDGGWGSSAPSDPSYTPTAVGAAFDGWSSIDGCDPATTTEDEPTGIAETSRRSCVGGSSVTSRVSTGYGHAWPDDVLPSLVHLVSSAG